MPTATMLASTLRVNPRSCAIGRKKGPKLRRMPEDRSVRNAAAATMFQPKYQRAAMRRSYARPARGCQGWFNPAMAPDTTLTPALLAQLRGWEGRSETLRDDVTATPVRNLS